jgi:REP element-mobilizing transposase RayT
LDIPGLLHHVMARGIEGRDIFRNDDDREAFLKRLSDGVDRPGGPQLYAWALMSNHFHLLLQSGEGLLSPMMRRLMTGHAVSYNLRYKRQGHLFQNRYKSIVVEEETYFLELVRYIHLNPVRAGVVKTLEELASYPYSGHAVVMGYRDYSAQDIETVLTRFSARRKAAMNGYNRFVADGFDQGRREELRGGGLIRSAGGLRQLMESSPEERELSDERILGSGDFVASVLRDSDTSRSKGNVSVEDILKEIAEQSGVSPEQILGASRSRKVSCARRQFYYEAHQRAGAPKSMLGRLTGRSHVAVRLAIEQVRAELDGVADGEQLT